MFIVYIARPNTTYYGHVFVTTKTKETAFFARYSGMELYDREKWIRQKVRSHSVLFGTDDEPDRWLDAI
jgi:hypothetical protein